MRALSRLTRRIVPVDWRETVEHDLTGEASRRGFSGLRSDAWIAWHTVRVGIAFRWRNRVPRGGWRPAPFLTLRDAWRALRSSRGVAAFSVLILTAAIAAATVTFSVVDAVLLRSLPFEESDRLVTVGSRSAAVGVQSFIHFDAWRRQADSFELLAAGNLGPRAQLATSEGLTGVWTWQTTASLFEALRVSPIMGRLFTAENEVVGRNAVAVIGYRTWYRAFGGDPNVIGKSLRLLYRTKDPSALVTIVGVMPAGFRYPLDSRADIWIPHAFGMYTPRNPRDGYLSVVGRLRDGVTPDQARAQLETIYAATAAAHALPLRDGWQPVATSLVDTLVGSRKAWMLVVLWASVLLMLVACVNVASLLLSRSTERARELSLRASLGASPRRLAVTLLVESLMLSLTAAALGVLIAHWGVAAAKAALPVDVFRAETIAIDLRVLIVTASAAIAAAVFFGVVPAWQAARAQPVSVLGNGTWAVTPSHRRWRTSLVTVEVALVGALLVVSTLFVTSFARVVQADLGFVRSNLVGFSLEDFKGATTPILEVLRRTPGVVSVAEWAGPPPPLTSGGVTVFDAIKAAHHANEPGEILAARYRISPGYFETTGIPLLRGRAFTEADAESPVAIIDELAASLLFFDGRDPLGADIWLGPNFPPHTIVGIARTVNREGPEADTGTQLYRPRATGTAGAFRFLIRASAPVSQVISALEQSLPHALPAGTPMPPIHSLDEAFRTMTAARRANATLMSIFGVIVLLIGAAGVYAVMASIVAQQQRELGVRVALGATPERIIRGVLGRAAVYLIAGLGLGLAAGRAISTLFASMLFQVRPADLSTYAIVAALLVAVGLLAALLPALRAGRVDPIITLRAQ